MNSWEPGNIPVLVASVIISPVSRMRKLSNGVIQWHGSSVRERRLEPRGPGCRTLALIHRSLPVQEVWEWDWGWGSQCRRLPLATPSPAFHPALRDLMVLSSILQPSIFVTPIPPLHPQTTQAFHPTWSSPILPAPISASHPAVSDPNFSLFPGPALAYPPSFSPALALLLQFGSPGHGGPACQGKGRWGLSIREPGAGAGGSLRVPAHPLGRQFPACARLGHQCDGGIYEPSHRPQLSQPRKSLPSPGDGLPRQLGPRIPLVWPVPGAPRPHAPPQGRSEGRGTQEVLVNHRRHLQAGHQVSARTGKSVLVSRSLTPQLWSPQGTDTGPHLWPFQIPRYSGVQAPSSATWVGVGRFPIPFPPHGLCILGSSFLLLSKLSSVLRSCRPHRPPPRMLKTENRSPPMTALLLSCATSAGTRPRWDLVSSPVK